MASTVHVNRMKNDRLIHLFDTIAANNPKILEAVPDGAVLVMQIDGDREFNHWSLDISQKNHLDATHVYVQFVLSHPFSFGNSISSGEPKPESIKLEINHTQILSLNL